MSFAEIADSFFKPAVQDLVPYEPGKPVEEVQRELGLERVVKLASNEGPFGPFPEALEALARDAEELNRYPDGGSYRLRTALAELHDVRFEEVAPGRRVGRDRRLPLAARARPRRRDRLRVALLPELRDRRAEDRRGARSRFRCATTATTSTRCSRRSGRATKLVYVCHPNNPTGTMNTRAELDAYFDAVPEHVLTVLDQAYYEYIDDPEYVDGLEYLKAGRKAVVLRTFSKIYGLAGLRVGYAVGPAELVTAIGEGSACVRRQLVRAGRRAREPRRAGRAGAPPQRERGGPRRARADHA